MLHFWFNIYVFTKKKSSSKIAPASLFLYLFMYLYWNLILLKYSALRNPWRVYARISQQKMNKMQLNVLILIIITLPNEERKPFRSKKEEKDKGK